MADVKTVAIRLKAYNQEYKQAMKESGDATAAFGKVGVVALAAVGVAAVAFAKKAADAYVAYGRSIMGLSRVTGSSIETSSKFAFAAQQSGVSVETLTNGVKFLQKNMAAGNPIFEKLNVSTRNVNGGFRDSHEVFLDAADALAKMENGAAKTDAILKIFGRSGLALGPMLSKNKTELLALENQARSYGLVLSGDNVNDIKANVKAHREMDAAMLGLQVQIGQHVVPALTTMTEGTTDFIRAAGQVPAPVLAIGAGLTAVVVLGPKVVAGFKAMQLSGSLMSNAMGGVAAVGIAVLLKGLNDVQDKSKETSAELSAGINFGNRAEAGAGIDEMGRKVDELGAAWNDMSAAEKLANPDVWKVYIDAAAQYEEHLAHIAEMDARVLNIASALGITAESATALTDSLKFDPTTADPAKYIPILKGVANGTITAADAQAQLAAATRDATSSTEDQAAAMDEMRRKTKEANDEQAASVSPQMAYAAAEQKVIDAQKGVTNAERALEASHRAVRDAQDGVVEADRRRQDAANKVTDAVRTQQEAQQRLNDLLAGPSQSEADNIEAAQIALAEAKRRQAGLTDTDPALEARRNALDVRRAEQGLADAQGAHGEAIKQAQNDLAAATQAVADARQNAADSVKAVEDAQLLLVTSNEGVTTATDNLNQAQLNVFASATDLDAATRNLMTAYDTGDVSIDKNKEALNRWVEQGLITEEQAWNTAAALAALHEAAASGNPDAIMGAAGAVGPGSLEKGRTKGGKAGGNVGGSAPVVLRRDGNTLYMLDPDTGRQYRMQAGASSGGTRRGLVPVNEQGTEMLSMGGKDYLMLGQQGFITPHRQLVGAGGGGSTDNSFTIENLTVGSVDDLPEAKWQMRKLAISRPQ